MLSRGRRTGKGAGLRPAASFDSSNKKRVRVADDEHAEQQSRLQPRPRLARQASGIMGLQLERADSFADLKKDASDVRAAAAAAATATAALLPLLPLCWACRRHVSSLVRDGAWRAGGGVDRVGRRAAEPAGRCPGVPGYGWCLRCRQGVADPHPVARAP